MGSTGILLLQDGTSKLVMQDGVSFYLLGPLSGSISVMGAINKRVHETPSLIDRLPGGFWTGTPDEEADNNPPYGVLSFIAETVAGYVTQFYPESSLLKQAVPSGWRTRLQVSLIGKDYGGLEETRQEWENVIGGNMEPLSIIGRRHRATFNTNVGVDFGNVPALPSGTNSVVIHWEVEIITNRRSP